MMTKQDMVMQNDTYTLIGLVSGFFVFSGWLVVGILGALVVMGSTPATTRKEQLGMVASAFGSSFFIGPLVIEAYGFSHYSFQAKLGICFICASMAWLVWSIIRTVFQKWRDSKNPIDAISKDIKKIKKWF